ncbi:MAG: hypothetical protein IT458_07100 [Planctomycetes bacterium]|nr:hypothetical protein [Planctomycetota bacterium]
MSRRVSRSALLLLAAAAAGCRSATVADPASLAAADPLPYSVLVSGGGFVTRGLGGAPETPLQSTYPIDPAEAFPLASVTEALRRGRVFVRLEQDQRGADARAHLAAMAESPTLGDLPAQELLREAREGGHDYVLLLERLQDGPIEQGGINEQWPLTISTWFLLGLGFLIPDHTYESRATLRVSLREVQSGRTVDDRVLAAGPVDLSLVERGHVWSLLSSIVVPPFWAADDPEGVAVIVRELTTRRLMLALARQLKSLEVGERLRERAAAAIEVRREGRGVLVRIDSREPVSIVRLRLDRVPLRGAEAAEFERRLLHSATLLEGRVLRHEATWDAPLSGRHLQVLVQTQAGGVASVTVALREEGQ